MNNTTERKFIKTNCEGVFYRMSARRDAAGKQDRIYCFCYTDQECKVHWKTVGRHSNGFRVKSAKIARAEFLATLTEADPTETPIDPNYTVGQAVQAYYVMGRKNAQDFGSSYNTYATHVAPAIEDTPISQISKAKVISIVALLNNAKRKFGYGVNANKPLAQSTIVGVLSFLRAAINRAIENNDWAGINPFTPMDGTWSYKPNSMVKRLRFLTREEAKQLLDELAQTDRQTHDMVLLSLRTGLRPTEIFRLVGADLDINASVLHILAKGKKRMSIKVPGDIMEMLASYERGPAEPIFQRPKLKTAFKHTPKPFYTAIKRLKLEPEDGNPLYHITFHTMRHTFASWLAQSGKVTLLELQKLMRHQKIEMTLRYAHLIPGQESSKLSIIDEFLGQ